MTLISIEKPVFFIGVPRSGTTIIFEAFARHEAVAWPSIYSREFPGWPVINILRRFTDNRFVEVVGKKKQHAVVLPGNRYLPAPDEAYEFWDKYAGNNFSRSYLLEKTADKHVIRRVRSEVGKILKWQHKQRFVAKLTGPARIGFIRSIFPDAVFVHVVRDGPAVVRSLLNVDFWKRGGGYDRPWWEEGFPCDLLQYWRENGQLPSVLAALQWQHIVDTARKEAKTLAPNQYREVNYQEFIANPKQTVDDLLKFCGLGPSRKSDAYIKALPHRKEPKVQQGPSAQSDESKILLEIYSRVSLG